MEIASSVERFGRYANWSGSSVLGRPVLIFCMTNLSKHFIIYSIFRCCKYVSIIPFSACENVIKCMFCRTTFDVKYELS